METDLPLRVVGKHLSVKICTNVQLDNLKIQLQFKNASNTVKLNTNSIKRKIWRHLFVSFTSPITRNLELGESLW